MFKKLILFSTIAVLGGCETINQAKQCDPDKNYMISNPQAIEEYKKLKSEGKIRSYYHKDETLKFCDNDRCANFDVNKYDFIEMYFNNKDMKGVYTLKASKDLNNKNCLKSVSSSERIKNFCYVLNKNSNDIIISDYEWSLTKNNNVTILEFKNIKNNELLFKNSYQVYSTGAIGGPGGGICPKSYVNNPSYKFNTYAFP